MVARVRIADRRITSTLRLLVQVTGFLCRFKRSMQHLVRPIPHKELGEMRLPVATASIFLGCLLTGAPADVSEGESFDAGRHQRSLAPVVFSLNMLPRPNGVLELNLVLRDKVHELCSWMDGHAIRKFAGVFINPINAEGAYNLHTSATIWRESFRDRHHLAQCRRCNLYCVTLNHKCVTNHLDVNYNGFSFVVHS